MLFQWTLPQTREQFQTGFQRSTYTPAYESKTTESEMHNTSLKSSLKSSFELVKYMYH